MGFQVSAVLLAAGLSRRMGRLKQLLPLGDKTVVRRCLETITAAGIEDTVVVVGLHGEEILKHLDNVRVTIACNNIPGSEMADSVRTGIGHVKQSSTGVLVCLCDHPLVSPDTIKRLIDLHAERPDKILVPTYKAKKGHPSLFPRQVIHEIYRCADLREIQNSRPDRVELVEVTDEGVLFDMDTFEDYKKIA